MRAVFAPKIANKFISFILGTALYLRLDTGYRTLSCISMVLKVLAAGTNCYNVGPVISGAEWRLQLYKNGSKLFEILFDLVSPLDLPEFRGEFGLYHLLQLTCEKIIDRVHFEHFNAVFKMPVCFLTRKFLIL